MDRGRLRGIQKCVALVLCACSAAVAAGPAGLWLDVPFVKQERYGCGAASIAMVMQYWQRQQNKTPNDESDARNIQQSLYSQQAHGIYASDAETYLRQHGFRTFAFQGRWDDLRQHLQKGRPLIVALKPNSGNTPLHYVVAAGLDQKPELILVNDPATRKLLKQGRSDFEREWKGAGNWTLLAIPNEAAPSAR
jgi:ABC-type bacteriocin/lantibiotic exporter with double-glycine peptidase domain